MAFHKQVPLFASTLFCLMFSSFVDGQTVAPVAPTPAPAVAPSSTPITESDLRARYVGKLIFLRDSYVDDELNFDMNGKVNGSPAAGSFTLSALEVTKVKLSKHKLDLEADRYGLHFLAAVPYEDNSKTFDKVKISKKPVRISIERELIVIPKVKKEKKKKGETNPQPSAVTLTASAPAAPATAAPTPAAPTPAAPVPTALATAASAPTAPAAVGVSPAHSAMLMNKALDDIFAGDPKMIAHLPDYWKEYFNSQSEHRPFMPADAAIKMVGEGVAAPTVLNMIDPTSNDYAQQFGIAGMDVLRTVVDATGVPRQIAIDRPIGFGLDEKAVDAVKHSRFRPATLNGQPVPVVIDLVVTFRIYSGGTQPGAVLAASSGDSNASLSR